jgi:sec-independent protein translocase protein TatA
MGGFSGLHLLLLGVILIVLFGPSRLPKAGQSIGEAIRGFKKGLNGDEIDVTDQSKNANLNPPQQDPLTQQQQQQKTKTRQEP